MGVWDEWDDGYDVDDNDDFFSGFMERCFLGARLDNYKYSLTMIVVGLASRWGL